MLICSWSMHVSKKSINSIVLICFNVYFFLFYFISFWFDLLASWYTRSYHHYRHCALFAFSHRHFFIYLCSATVVISIVDSFVLCLTWLWNVHMYKLRRYSVECIHMRYAIYVLYTVRDMFHFSVLLCYGFSCTLYRCV